MAGKRNETFKIKESKWLYETFLWYVKNIGNDIGGAMGKKVNMERWLQYLYWQPFYYMWSTHAQQV
jgi:hypothetical protein